MVTLGELAEGLPPMPKSDMVGIDVHGLDGLLLLLLLLIPADTEGAEVVEEVVGCCTGGQCVAAVTVAAAVVFEELWLEAFDSLGGDTAPSEGREAEEEVGVVVVVGGC